MFKIRSEIILEGEQVEFLILIGENFALPFFRRFSHFQIQQIEKSLKALNLNWKIIPGHKINFQRKGLS